MKKLTGAALSLLAVIFLLFPVLANAAETTTYQLPELSIEVDIPAEYSVVTRSSVYDNGSLAKANIDVDELQKHFKKNFIYLDAADPELITDILFVMVQTAETKQTGSYVGKSDSFMEKEAEKVRKELQDSDISFEIEGIHKSSYSNFIQIHMVDEVDGYIRHGRQFYTIVNSRAISVTLWTYSDDFDGSLKQIHLNVVNSIRQAPISSLGESGFSNILISILPSLIIVIVISAVITTYNIKSSALKKKLSRCVVYGVPEPGTSFIYKNRVYDKEKFIQLYIDDIGQANNTETIERALKKAKVRSMRDGQGAVISRLEVEACKRILRKIS